MRSPRLRPFLPWIISLAALIYVFGFATDWRALAAATRTADLPVFLAVTIVDKLIFFLAWGLLQAECMRRFAGPVRRREVIALRGGSELVRAANASLGDAAFLLGVSRLVPGRLATVVAAGTVPLLCHVLVLVGQASLALPFLDGGYAANRDVVIGVAAGWTVVVGAALMVRVGPRLGSVVGMRMAAWLERMDLRAFWPIVASFAGLGLVDITVQKWTTASFGLAIPWSALVARIPILYAVMTVPSLGNFGTRELAWAHFFGEFGDRDRLVAYAFATNASFLVMNVVIGVCFLPRALELVAEVRRAREAGAPVDGPLLVDRSDP
ncbi:MAG TPA: hypothetical protein VMW35_13725 [Myxococcota bacterium]|nr:hypothetical protein [Myxococcota bacterium]